MWRECLNVTCGNLPLQRPLSDIKQSLARVGSRSAPWTRCYPDRGGGSLGGSLHNTSSLSPFSRTFLMNVSHSCIFAFSLQCHTKDLRRSGHVITPSDSRSALLTCPVLSCPVLQQLLGHPDLNSPPFLTPPPPPCFSFTVFVWSSRAPLGKPSSALKQTVRKKKTLYISCVVQYFIYSVSLFLLYIIFLHG